MDYSPPGSSIHGDSPGRILEWVAMPSSRGIFPTQWLNPGVPHCKQILYCLSNQGSLRILEWVAYPFFRGSSWPKNRTGVSCTADSLPAELPGKPLASLGHPQSGALGTSGCSRVHHPRTLYPRTLSPCRASSPLEDFLVLEEQASEFNTKSCFLKGKWPGRPASTWHRGESWPWPGLSRSYPWAQKWCGANITSTDSYDCPFSRLLLWTHPLSYQHIPLLLNSMELQNNRRKEWFIND